MELSMNCLHQKQRLSLTVNSQSDLYKIKAGCTYIFDCEQIDLNTCCKLTTFGCVLFLVFLAKCVFR